MKKKKTGQKPNHKDKFTWKKGDLTIVKKAKQQKKGKS